MMADETFGTLGVFLYASIGLGIVGWILPRILIPQSWNLVLAAAFSFLASLLGLIVISSITSLFIQASQHGNPIRAIAADPIGAVAYFTETGAELSVFGLVALLVSWILKVW